MIDPRAETTRLLNALDKRARDVAAADAWYDGHHPIPNPPPNTAAAVDAEARSAFNEMAKLSVTNLLPPIVDAPAMKLAPQGFRFSASRTATDDEAWRIWCRNDLETEGESLIHAAIRVGSCPVLVWGDSDRRAEITVEDPAQAIVAYVAGSRRQRRSALKRWRDDDGYLLATTYLPDGIYKWRSRTASTPGLHLPGSASELVPREVPGEAWPLPNPLSEVPMVEVAVNRGIKARPFGGGLPQFDGELNEQRKINQTVMNLLVTMEYQAFRQRWVTGWDFPLLPDGTPDKVAIAKASAARVMAFDGDNATAGSIKVGEFSQADFTPFGRMLEVWTKVMSSTSGTPPYAFMLGDMVNVAADALARIDGYHIAKVASLSRQIGGRLGSEVMRLALKVEGNPKANDDVISTVWGEFESRTGAEQAEMAQALDAIGAPKEAVFAAFGNVDAAEAARWARQARADVLFGDLTTTDA